MRKIEFLDTSLRDGEQTPGVNFSIKEKVAIAKQLEKWGISAIEAGFPAASPDSLKQLSRSRRHSRKRQLRVLHGLSNQILMQLMTP